MHTTTAHTPPHTPTDSLMCLLSGSWFHGDISSSEAARRLQKGPGAFLVRFSQSTADYAGAFTVTRINEKGATVNIRINQDKTGGFSVNRDSTYPDLEVLIQDLKDTLFLKHACKVHDTRDTHTAHDTTHAHTCVRVRVRLKNTGIEVPEDLRGRARRRL
jgi:hypothetical protein